ncbi:EAL domain-containing protein [Quadrisphaera sp. KR29]|uniref:EAL domain-containing protein n=1 Tax=Quadrisphaera sp. KR29 TaxID=3461391 RepID=UPI004044D4EA
MTAAGLDLLAAGAAVVAPCLAAGAVAGLLVRRRLARAAAELAAADRALRQVHHRVRLGSLGDHEAALQLPELPGDLGSDLRAWAELAARAEQAREVLAEQLDHQAAHDSLTGLPVRWRVLEQLGRVLLADRDAGRCTGLLLVDLDGFQAVNDHHGHAAGDGLLRAAAARLAAAAGPGALVGRLGGDEFAVVVPAAGGADDLRLTAARLVGALAEPVHLPGCVLAVTASAGAALADPGAGGNGDGAGGDGAGGDGAEQAARALLAEAATAAHRAKAAGRGRVELFDDALRRRLAEDARTEQALRTALALAQLRVVYQPVVPLTGTAAEGCGSAWDAGGGVLARVLGVEALLRWDRPGHGPVDPAVVVAAAERCGLVRDLEAFVLCEAALQLVRWSARGRDVPVVSVNLSARHLADPRVVPDVLEALATAGLEPARLQLEVSEPALLAGDGTGAAAHLQALRAHGVRVALDDFGTGSTSIAALATTPADQLKVDSGLTAAAGAAAGHLLELTARAGAAFGLQVVAEGVETAAQAERAAAAGCTGGQGWHFAPALAADELEPRLPLLSRLTEGTAAPVR